MIAGKDKIESFIPQKQPMVMIDTLESAENGRTVTTLTVRKENIFFSGGKLREPALIENIAQTAAAGVGFIAKSQQKEPPVGFIGGIRNLRINRLPGEGETIRTEVTVDHEVFEARVVTGKIFSGDELIAEGELKIFLLKEPVQDNH